MPKCPEYDPTTPGGSTGGGALDCLNDSRFLNALGRLQERKDWENLPPPWDTLLGDSVDAVPLEDVYKCRASVTFAGEPAYAKFVAEDVDVIKISNSFLTLDTGLDVLGLLTGYRKLRAGILLHEHVHRVQHLEKLIPEDRVYFTGDVRRECPGTEFDAAWLQAKYHGADDCIAWVFGHAYARGSRCTPTNFSCADEIIHTIAESGICMGSEVLAAITNVLIVPGVISINLDESIDTLGQFHDEGGRRADVRIPVRLCIVSPAMNDRRCAWLAICVTSTLGGCIAPTGPCTRAERGREVAMNQESGAIVLPEGPDLASPSLSITVAKSADKVAISARELERSPEDDPSDPVVEWLLPQGDGFSLSEDLRGWYVDAPRATGCCGCGYDATLTFEVLLPSSWTGDELQVYEPASVFMEENLHELSGWTNEYVTVCPWQDDFCMDLRLVGFF